MRYIVRAIQIIRIIAIKFKLRKCLKTTSPLYSYSINKNTEIKCGNNGRMILGDIGAESNVHLVSWGGILNIGARCSFNRNDIVVSRKRITIGEGTLIGPNVCIYDHDHAFDGKGIIKDKLVCSDVEIGKNVWIGAGTIILRGTTIGNNCIIGAGCIVKGKIPDCSLVTSENRNLVIKQLL